MSTLSVNTITDASGGNTAKINTYTPTESNMMGKNRIINGDMRIDQRNAGASVTASVTPTLTYTLDRWSYVASQASKFTVQRNAGSVTPPVGFTNYLGVTSSSAYSVLTGDYFFISQQIEGLNTADLAWGTANAQTITVSFWVRSSLTGTFGGIVCNSAQDRSYPFTYSVSAANTWEQKSVTIAGDTTGTWLTTNGTGVWLKFGIGVGSTYSGTANAWSSTQFLASVTGATSVVGTDGATWYVTGVQLEVGSVATPFERRPYGTELALCQRYYYRITSVGANDVLTSAYSNSATQANGMVFAPVDMRVAPTSLDQTGTAGDYLATLAGANNTGTSVPTLGGGGTTRMLIAALTTASTQTAGNAGIIRTASAGKFLGWSAEL
jgi:hypothetical protein